MSISNCVLGVFCMMVDAYAGCLCGQVSRAGSPDGGGYANGGYDDRPGGADIIDDDDDDDDDDF